MATNPLQSLRPRNSTAAEIASSIERMSSALIEMKGELAATQGSRRTVLLTGTNADLDRADSRITTLTRDVERIEASIEALRPDLSAARGRERLEQVEALRIEAAEATEQFREFWHGRYGELAAAIVTGLTGERAARDARARFDRAVAQAAADADVEAVGGVPTADLPPMPWGYISTNAMKSPSLLICLPSVEPGRALAWPDHHTLAPIRPANEATVYG